MNNLERYLQDLKIITNKGKLSIDFNVKLFSDYYEGKKINPKKYPKNELNLFKKVILKLEKKEPTFDKGFQKENNVLKLLISYFDINSLKKLIATGRI